MATPMDDFLLLALAAGFGVTMVAGPLGCFMVWRRMSYFGATLSHSALLGVALGILLGINMLVGVIGVCLAIAMTLYAIESDYRFAADTILGILAHGILALGLVVVASLENVTINLMGYLFGDILAVAPFDLVWVYGGGAFCLVLLSFIWRGLLSMTVHEGLAFVDGIEVSKIRLIFMLMIAFVIAISMKIVGILLVISLLIIPPATARIFARTPEQMAFYAVLLGWVAVLGGLSASANFDVPAGPSIVVVSMLIFFLAAMPGLAKGRM